MKRIRVAPKARNDIKACAAWIRKDNPTAAQRFVDAVSRTCDEIAQMPGIGSLRYADIPLIHGVRMIAVREFENYLLFYLEHEASVDVIRLLHGARDIPEALQS